MLICSHDQPMSRASRPGLPPIKQATIKDVAVRAGVSVATASRVFSKADVVSEALRDRVLEAARTLIYRPSRAARLLRAGTSQTIGVVIPDLQNPFFTAVVRGLDHVLRAPAIRCS
jgi:LacI family transcriptional regulator